MYQAHDYCRTIASEPQLRSMAETVYDLVWRFDFSAPGFAVIETGVGCDSHTLRSWMVTLKERLSDIGVRRGHGPFGYRSMSRFDQQQTTKFHLDGAPDQSLLMLGYEPSQIRSRLFLADYIFAASQLGMTADRFLQDFNPMFSEGEEMLNGYATELPQPMAGCSRIVLINNSCQPWTEARVHSLGVMHKAIVDTPDPAERRVINSTMLALSEVDDFSLTQRQEYIETDQISPKLY